MRTFQTFIKESIPILDWLPNYKRTNLSGDLYAGLIVGIMLIPQGMAYAMLAGLDPIHGLYAATIPLVLYAFFGSSRQLAVGPVAMDSMLTAASIIILKPENPQMYLVYAITLAFLVGVIQFGLGILRFGFVVNFLSHPVINGFTSAAAVLIGLSQVPHLFGIEFAQSILIQEIIYNIGQQIINIHWITLFIGLIGISILFIGKKLTPTLPISLIVVALSIIIVQLFNLADNGVQVIGSIPSGLPTLSIPLFELNTWITMIPFALTIAFVGFAESYTIAKTVNRQHKDYKLNANQELIGLGMANFGASFFQGFPVTGGFSRTAVNNQSGAKTGLASLVSAALIIITLLYFTELFYHLPKTILAAVILVAVSSLIDTKTPLSLWKKDRMDFVMLISTFFITLTLGIQYGIILGMSLSLIAVIYSASRPHMATLGRVPGTNYFKNISRFPNLENRPDLLVLRIDGPIYFANLNYIKERIDKLMEEKGDALKTVVLNFESITSIDSSGAKELEEWIKALQYKQINTCITGAKGPVRDTLHKWGIVSCVGQNHVFNDDATAVDYFDHKIDANQLSEMQKYSLQQSKDD